MAFDCVLSRWIAISILHLLFIPIILLITCSTKMMRMRKSNSKKRNDNVDKESNPDRVRLIQFTYKMPTNSDGTHFPYNVEKPTINAYKALPERSSNNSNARTAREIRQHMVVPSTDDLLATSAISVENTLFMPRNLSSIREEPELESVEGKLIEGEVFIPLSDYSDNFDVRSVDSFPWPTNEDVAEFRQNRRHLLSDYDRELHNRRNHRRARGQSSKSTSSTSCSSHKSATPPSPIPTYDEEEEEMSEKRLPNRSCPNQKSIEANH